MIEKITLQLSSPGHLEIGGHTRCEELNPKALLLLSAAKCASLTALHILDKERVHPKRFEMALSGELSTDTIQSESMYLSFHAMYNIECASGEEQTKARHAIELTQERHCSMMQMLRMIAPVSYEMAITSPHPAKV